MPCQPDVADKHCCCLPSLRSLAEGENFSKQHGTQFYVRYHEFLLPAENKIYFGLSFLIFRFKFTFACSETKKFLILQFETMGFMVTYVTCFCGIAQCVKFSIKDSNSVLEETFDELVKKQYM